MDNQEQKKVFTREQFLTWLEFMKAIMLHEEANPDEDMISIHGGFTPDDQDFYISFRTDSDSLKSIVVYDDGFAAISYITRFQKYTLESENDFLKFYTDPDLSSPSEIPFAEIVSHLLSL